MPINIETPWGIPDFAHELAPGITRYDTPSHGGYHVSSERVAEMPKPLQAFRPFAGSNWYEEDCDWCIVALAFPQFFPADHASRAIETLKRYEPALHAEFVKWKAARVTAR